MNSSVSSYFRTGLYPPPSFPYTLGREGAGTIVSHGPNSGSSLPTGFRVACMSTSSYAEYAVASTDKVLPLPSAVPTQTGAAMMIQGLTALTMIREAHSVQPGDWILVHAAAGGTGLWLCQLLHAVGVHVIGTASSPAKRELAKQNGAEVVLDYPENVGGHDAFVTKVKKLTGGNGVPAVFDGVGKSTFDVSLDCLARKGTMVSFGNASGAVPPFTISRLSAKNAKVVRPTLFNYVATRDEFERYGGELSHLVAEKKISVKVHDVFDLKDVAKAQQELEERHSTGKILMRP